MTPEEFIQWLDAEIELADKMFCMGVQKYDSESFYSGALETLESVKEKFLTLLPPPTTLS